MGVILSVRGDSLDARVSQSGKTPTLQTTVLPYPSAVVDGAVLGGSKIDMRSGQTSSVDYPGASNFSENQAFSILIRTKLTTAWPPSAGQKGFMYAVAMGGFKVMRWVVLPSGAFNLILPNAMIGNNISASTSSFVPNRSIGDEVDVFMCTDGVSGNTVDFYIDGVLIDTLTLTANNTLTLPFWATMAPLMSVTSGRSAGDLIEWVIWNTKEDPTAILLADDSTASLNGPSRTQFVKAPTFNAQDFDNLDVANVRSGFAYEAAGIAKEGELDSTEVFTELLEAEIAGGPLTGVIGDGD